MCNLCFETHPAVSLPRSKKAHYPEESSQPASLSPPVLGDGHMTESLPSPSYLEILKPMCKKRWNKDQITNAQRDRQDYSIEQERDLPSWPLPGQAGPVPGLSVHSQPWFYTVTLVLWCVHCHQSPPFPKHTQAMCHWLIHASFLWANYHNRLDINHGCKSFPIQFDQWEVRGMWTV